MLAVKSRKGISICCKAVTAKRKLRDIQASQSFGKFSIKCPVYAPTQTERSGSHSDCIDKLVSGRVKR